MNRVLLLASENGAFKGAKVGGIADVIRDLPAPLYEQGVKAEVIMPSYGFLLQQPDLEQIAEYWVEFRSKPECIRLFKGPNPTCPEVDCYFLDNPLWQQTPGKIYHDSGARPFAEDADTFALFCAAVAEALLKGLIDRPDCIHIHDWHTAFYLLIAHFMPHYRPLQSIDTVLTIHNLAIQGIRPLQYDHSSLEAWYPELFAHLSDKQMAEIVDPRYSNCLNPLRTGINLADRVHVVSPTYAKEILLPSDPENGFFGGEGLEQDLNNKRRKLFGIINGCNYPKNKIENNQSFTEFLDHAQETITQWQGQRHALSGQDFIATKRLQQLADSAFEPEFLLTSVGRLTDQKMLLLRQPTPKHPTLLDAVLEKLANFSDRALFILVGSGDADLTKEFRQVAARWTNFIFLNGYAESLPTWLYQNGDLFLMPSSFEPCGISQMLAMRDGQPCIVHAVGGLKDTVEHDKSGFVFTGNNLPEQADNLIHMLDYALATFKTPRWAKIKRSAKARRFSWTKVAKQMKQKLYRLT